jgi:hypothetical protein
MSLKLWMARNAKVPVTFARGRKESQSRNKQRKEARLAQRIAQQELATCKNALLSLARHLAGSWYIPFVLDDDGDWRSTLIDDVRDDKIQLKGLDFFYSFSDKTAQFVPVRALADLVLDLMIPDEEFLCDMYSLGKLCV